MDDLYKLDALLHNAIRRNRDMDGENERGRERGGGRGGGFRDEMGCIPFYLCFFFSVRVCVCVSVEIKNRLFFSVFFVVPIHHSIPLERLTSGRFQMGTGGPGGGGGGGITREFVIST